MLDKLYGWLYKATARGDDKHDRFGGCIQSSIRDAALELCAGCEGKALEIGTGSGLFLIKLAAQSPRLELWSVDNNGENLGALAAKIEVKGLRNIHMSVQDAQRMSFDDDYFDIVICVNLFIDMDIGTVAKVLAEMKRVAKPNGRVVFEFRNRRNMLFRLKYKLAKYYDPSAPYPLYTYDPLVIEGILKDIGLEVIGKKYLGFPVNYFAPIIMVEARKR